MFVPDNDWSSRLFGASFNIQGQVLPHATHEVLALHPPLLVGTAVMRIPDHSSPWVSNIYFFSNELAYVIIKLALFCLTGRYVQSFSKLVGERVPFPKLPYLAAVTHHFSLSYHLIGFVQTQAQISIQVTDNIF